AGRAEHEPRVARTRGDVQPEPSLDALDLDQVAVADAGRNADAQAPERRRAAAPLALGAGGRRLVAAALAARAGPHLEQPQRGGLAQGRARRTARRRASRRTRAASRRRAAPRTT